MTPIMPLTAPDAPAVGLSTALPAPPLTVLIPVYNEERTIDELLRRVADGPYPDKEVIVIDDGSSDRTPRLLEAWSTGPASACCVMRRIKARARPCAPDLPTLAAK
jgi:hypothetical protein